MTRLLACLALIILAACGSGSAPSGLQGTTIIDGVQVNWKRSPVRGDAVKDGLTPLFFVFSDANPRTSVTEADYEREAALQGVSIFTIKAIMPQPHVYKTSEGRLASCTYIAMEKGLCGKKLGLNTNQRADLARRALAQSDACRWVGFDPAFNHSRAYSAGAYNATLWLYASCG